MKVDHKRKKLKDFFVPVIFGAVTTNVDFLVNRLRYLFKVWFYFTGEKSLIDQSKNEIFKALFTLLGSKK